MIKLVLDALGVKVWMAWLAVAGVVAAYLAIIVLRARASGRQAERLSQLERTLRQYATETKDKARIDAMSASDARRRLRERWSAR